MANVIKTRILNKYDIFSNYSNSFVPLRGEICLVEIPSGTSPLTPPAVGIKVGDGTKTFEELDWVQAIAGDVSSFIKGINENNFSEKVGKAIGYEGATNVKTIIEGLNTALDGYYKKADTYSKTELDTKFSGKVDNQTLANYQTQISGLLDKKVETSAFTTYQAEVTAALDKKVETSLLDTINVPAANNKLMSEKTVDAKIKTASDTLSGQITGLSTKIGSANLTTDAKDTLINAINEVDAHADTNAADILELQQLVGLEAGGESLTQQVADLRTDVDGLTDVLDGYTTKSSVQTAIADAKKAGTDAQGQIGNIDNLAGKKATLVEEINDVRSYVTGTVEGNISDINDKVEKLIGDDANMSVRDITADFVADALAGGGESFDTLQEIAAWLKDHPEDVGEINEAIQALEALHATEGGSFKTVAEEVAAGIAGANLDQYVDDTTFEAYQTEIADAIAAARTALQKADITEGTSNGTIAVDGADVKVHGLGSAAYTASTAYATAGQGNTADSALQSVKVLGTTLTKNSNEITVAAAKTALGLGSAAYEDADAFDAAGAAAGVQQAISTTISQMDANYADTNAGVMTAITQVDGKITSVTQRKIKNADLDTDDVFVFYCGQSPANPAGEYVLTTVNV